MYLAFAQTKTSEVKMAREERTNERVRGCNDDRQIKLEKGMLLTRTK
jgi:hypothetical protein